MELYEDLLVQASHQLQIAEHMLNETYPFVKDPKMLPAIVERLYCALDYALTALLRCEHNHNRIPSYKDDFDEKCKIFKKTAKRYKLKSQYGLEEIRDLVVKHRQTQLAFARKENFVMVKNHKIDTLSLIRVKGFLSKTKIFIDDIRNQLRTQNV
ncbi:MAG: hypothetical protein AABX70_03225 [Nanoarchaeota archaeon]